MININLLPFNLRPIKHSPIPHVASVLVAGLAVLCMTALWVNKQHEINKQREVLESNQSQLQALQAIVDEYERLDQQKLVLADKIAIINEILADRIIWSKQLWNVSRLTPDNFWYSNIAVKDKQFSETRKELDPKTKKEITKKVVVKRPVLELTGYVIEGENGSNDINPLTFNMQADEEFSKTFQLDLPKLQDTEFEGYKVRGFTLEYAISTGGKGA